MNRSTALRLTGADALGLLHRISTNDLAGLSPGNVRATLFCDFRGRLLHRAVAGMTADGAVWLVRDDAPGADLAAFLDRHVFRDDVRIEDRSAHPVGLAWGAAGGAPGTLDEREGVPVALAVSDRETLVVGAAGANDSAPSERDRILAGRAGHGHEIVDAFTPFEVGLGHEVHLDKGCFTGQEALMRLITYKSVKRRLARIEGPGAPPPRPAELIVAGREAGVLTSAAAEGEGWIGLAVLRNEVCEPPVALTLADGTAIGPPQPFPPTRPLGRG